MLKHYVELEETGRLSSLSSFKIERKEFVQKSFEVSVVESFVLISRLLTSS